MAYKRYWLALAVVVVGSFAILGSTGRKMISQAPPIPDVYTTDGQLLFTGATVTDGQGVWQSIGGQEIGTVWGHGSYVAPDWSAGWLHRESEILLNMGAVRAGARDFAALGARAAALFWWTSWAAHTDRPGSTTTYTNNWPHEPLVGNEPTPGAVLWSLISFVGLLAGIGGLVWWSASQEKVLVDGAFLRG